MLKNKTKTATLLLLLSVMFLGLILRLWNINFGLPHSWYADEPEIGEPAIKYTYELRNILKNNDVYKLIPENYVYGTFPVYLYTLMVIVFSKTLGILGVAFTKMDVYVFMRVINATISFLMVPIFLLTLKRLGLTKRPLVLIMGAALISLNWKYIVHAHYLNHDIIITLLASAANFFFYLYLQNRHLSEKSEEDTVNTILFSLFFGLAVSTKITVLITLPIYIYALYDNKDFRNLFASIFIIIAAFIITNPFAVVFIGDLTSRWMEMRTKEAGLVLDSADYSPFKYLGSLSWTLTMPVFLLSVYGIVKSFQEQIKSRKQFYLAMFAQVLFYLAFFSLQNRRVDRWMLPIMPNLLIFALVGMSNIADMTKKSITRLVCIILLTGLTLYYLYFPVLLLKQFQRNTPKSASYIWAKENLPEISTKFGLTEEGLDPLNKLSYSTIWQYNTYESKGAQFMYPPDPLLYDYVLVSSRPLSWTKNPIVVSKYPYYSEKWLSFESALNNPRKFELIKSFSLQEPNLIPLSNVLIYKNLTVPEWK